jgi:tRNA nucleotidyltransferase/poly(A) polymerase
MHKHDWKHMKEQALKIIKKLREHGYEALYAGGYVRDMLLGVESADIDIATNARPEVVESLFEKTLAVGKAFGVIIVLMDEEEIEVATYRVDHGSDGRRPESITFCTMEEDAKRRDITINGMFYDPIEDKIYDAVGGIEDLYAGIIRFIGKPDDQITEDKLRLLRCVRFSAKFDFKIELETFEAMSRHASEISQVSAERIGDELLKILRTGNYRKAVNLLMDSGLMKEILPEIYAMKNIAQPADYHPEGVVIEHSIRALENLPKDASDELRMGVLFHDVGKPPTMTIEDRIRFNGHDIKGKFMTEAILKRLRFSNEFIDRVVALVENHMKFMHVKEMRTSRLKRFLALPHFEEHMLLHKADCMSSHENLENYEFVKEKLNSFKPEEIKPPKILTGKDLIDMGFNPGPIFSVIMNDVEDKQLEGSILNSEKAKEYVQKTYKCRLSLIDRASDL